ncbi:MAG: RNA polymerase sigma factor [Terriglobia bacterium]
MPDERDLVARCLAGDDSAWEALLGTYHRKVYNLCYRFTGNVTESEDLTQEIFIKIFQALAAFDPRQAQFSTWLNRISRNHLVDHYRRTRHDRAAASLDDEEQDIQPRAGPSSDPRAQVESRERTELVQNALQHLSPDMREVVILRDLQGMEYAEIALVLNVPEGTVKSRINRGRLELAGVLRRILKSERPE